MLKPVFYQGVSEAIGNEAMARVIGRNAHLYPITNQHPDPVFFHAA